MTDDPNHHALRNLHVVDIRREGRRWSREEADRNCLALHEHPDAPGKLEFVDGKFFHSEAQRLTMLGRLLEMVGADATERLGDPEIWRAAVESLSGQVDDTRAKKLEALADEVRDVVENAGWRERTPRLARRHASRRAEAPRTRLQWRMIAVAEESDALIQAVHHAPLTRNDNESVTRLRTPSTPSPRLARSP